MELNHTKHAVGQSAYHLVWRPKYNVKVFLQEYPRRVAEQAIKEAAAQHSINIIELRVMPDHVHCFAEIPETMSVSTVLQILKGASARSFFKKCTKWKAFFALDGQRKSRLCRRSCPPLIIKELNLKFKMSVIKTGSPTKTPPSLQLSVFALLQRA